MKIFPAIDIKDKKCVRLVKGDFDNKTEYDMSPVEQASKYKDHGFKNLHIVDLDGALTGETVNLDIIQDIVGKFNLKIEVGGGIRSIDSIQKYIDAGVEKVILGSAAIKDKNFLKESCEKFPKNNDLRLIISKTYYLCGIYENALFHLNIIPQNKYSLTSIYFPFLRGFLLYRANFFHRLQMRTPN